MDEIRQDLKDIKKDIASIQVDVAKNTVSLDMHIARTNLLQNLVTALIIAVIGGVIKLLIG